MNDQQAVIKGSNLDLIPCLKVVNKHGYVVCLDKEHPDYRKVGPVADILLIDVTLDISVQRTRRFYIFAIAPRDAFKINNLDALVDIGNESNDLKKAHGFKFRIIKYGDNNSRAALEVSFWVNSVQFALGVASTTMKAFVIEALEYVRLGNPESGPRNKKRAALKLLVDNNSKT